MSIVPSCENLSVLNHFAKRISGSLRQLTLSHRADVSSSLLLLLMLLVVTWRASSAGPLRASNVERCQGCAPLFRNLLGNVRELLKSVSSIFHCVFASDPPWGCVHARIFLLTGRSVFRHHVQQCGGEQQKRHPPGLRTQPDPGDL